jgi:L-serine 3-dehydrogenase (NAD+)
MGALALQLYRIMIKRGEGKLDFSAIQKLFTSANG